MNSIDIGLDRYNVCALLPLLEVFRQECSWCPEGDSCPDDPEYTELVQQLTGEAEGGVEVGGRDTDDHGQDPDELDAPRATSGERMEQMQEQTRKDDENSIARLKKRSN